MLRSLRYYPLIAGLFCLLTCIAKAQVARETGAFAIVGANIAIPRGAFVVQAKGMQVYPGFIDAGSALGHEEIDQVNATLDRAEFGLFQPDVVTGNAFHADSDHIAIERAEGITTTLSRPVPGGFGTSANLISGQGSVINLAGWTVEEMRQKNHAALFVSFLERNHSSQPQFTLTEEDKKKGRDEEKAQVRKLRAYFEKAKRYGQSRLSQPDLTPYDPILENMQPYVSKQLPVVFRVNFAYGIRQVVLFAESLGLTPIIETEADALKETERLAKKQITVIYHLPMTNSLDSSCPPHEYDPYDIVWAAPGLLQKAGVRLCFASSAGSMFGDESAAYAKNLPTQAGILRGYGMSDEAVLKALTLDAAATLGVQDSLGSISAGKIANVIVTDRDPLEITTHLYALFITGKPINLESRHTRLYEKFRQRLIPVSYLP